MSMQLNNLSIPTVWCDFNASGWSQEENDNCYYIFNKSSINQLDNITDIVVFAYMPENIEETLFVGCQAQIEICEDDYRLRPIEGSWISGTPFVIQAAVEKPIFIVNNHKVAVYEREELRLLRTFGDPKRPSVRLTTVKREDEESEKRLACRYAACDHRVAVAQPGRSSGGPGRCRRPAPDLDSGGHLHPGRPSLSALCHDGTART